MQYWENLRLNTVTGVCCPKLPSYISRWKSARCDLSRWRKILSHWKEQVSEAHLPWQLWSTTMFWGARWCNIWLLDMPGWGCPFRFLLMPLINTCVTSLPWCFLVRFDISGQVDRSGTWLSSITRSEERYILKANRGHLHPVCLCVHARFWLVGESKIFIMP